MTSTRDIDRQAMETAFEWLALLADGEVSGEQRRAFSAWLRADPAHSGAYVRAKLFWQDLGCIEREALDAEFFEASWRERLRSALWRAVRLRIPAKAMALGAAACILAVLFFTRQPSGLTTAPPADRVYATAIGETRVLALEDGSSITIGPATTVTVRFAPDSRQIEMGIGEAYFQVAKDSGRPFAVRSGELQVVVHGTSFDVRRSEHSTVVAVAEGIVSVSHAAASSVKTDSTPGRGAVTLVAGQRFLSRVRYAAPQVSETPQENVGAWRRKQLVYIDTPLSEIVADLNRYQPHPIRILGDGVGDIRVTATFSSDDIQGMLAALPGAFPIHIVPVANGIALIRAE